MVRKMNKSTKAIVAIVLVAGLLLVGAYVVMGDTWFTEVTPFGHWGQQIIINYADGSTESLSLIATNPLRGLSVTKDNVAIESITYNLGADVSMQGYTSVDINYASYSVNFQVNPVSGGATANSFSRNWLGAIAKNILTPGGAMIPICSATILASEIQGAIQTTADYSFVCVPSGTLTYTPRGGSGPDTDVVKTAALPQSVSYTIHIEYISPVTYSISVVFSQGVDWGQGTPSDVQIFTTQYGWNEVDTNGYLTISSPYNSIGVNQPYSSQSYVQKAFAKGITGAFTVEWDWNMQFQENAGVDLSGGWTGMIFAKNSTTTNYAIAKSTATLDGLRISYRTYKNETGVNYYLVRMETGLGTTWVDETAKTGNVDEAWAVEGETLHCKLVRDTDHSAHLYVYRASGALIDADSSGSTCDVFTDNTDIQHFVVQCGRGSSGTYTATGTIGNVKI